MASGIVGVNKAAHNHGVAEEFLCIRWCLLACVTVKFGPVMLNESGFVKDGKCVVHDDHLLVVHFEISKHV